MSQDSHITPTEQQIIEFYSLIGHQTERIIRRGERTSDFIIKAKDGEKRVTRCELRDEVDDTHVKALYQVMRDEGAAQATLITTGSLSAKAQHFAKGKPIRLADWSEFESLLRRARAQAQKKEQTPAMSPIQPETLKPQAEADTPLAKPYNTWAVNSLLFKPKYVALLGGILMILGSFLPWATWRSFYDPGIRSTFEQSPGRSLTLVIGIITVIGTLATKEIPGRNGSLLAAICGVWVIGITLEYYLRPLISSAIGYSIGPGVFLSSAGAIVTIVGGYQHNPGEVTKRLMPSASFGSWIDVWIKAATRPVVSTFEAIAKDPTMTLTKAYGWVFVASLIGLVVQVMSFQLAASLLPAVALPTCAPLPLGPFFLFWTCVPQTLVPFLLVLGLAIGGGITHWLARRPGGSGAYS